MLSRVMVFEVGHVECLEGTRIHVGVDFDSVLVRGDGRMDARQLAAFTSLLTAATWQAGQNRALMDAEAGT